MGRKVKEGRRNVLLSLDTETVAIADSIASVLNTSRSEIVKLAILTFNKDKKQLVDLSKKIELIREIVRK